MLWYKDNTVIYCIVEKVKGEGKKRAMSIFRDFPTYNPESYPLTTSPSTLGMIFLLSYIILKIWIALTLRASHPRISLRQYFCKLFRP